MLMSTKLKDRSRNFFIFWNLSTWDIAILIDSILHKSFICSFFSFGLSTNLGGIKLIFNHKPINMLIAFFNFIMGFAIFLLLFVFLEIFWRNLEVVAVGVFFKNLEEIKLLHKSSVLILKWNSNKSVL